MVEAVDQLVAEIVADEVTTSGRARHVDHRPETPCRFAVSVPSRERREVLSEDS